MKGEIKMSKWYRFAQMCQSGYGVEVDWHEGFFICPECGEPIYEEDWTDEDYNLGHMYCGKWYCPICESLLFEV